MNIYYSIDCALKEITGKVKTETLCGWGRLISTLRQSLEKSHTFVEDVNKADLELFVGQPPLYLYPQMHPAICLTMYESTLLPTLWTNSINTWDVCINPSTWGKQCFIESGVNIPIEVIPLPVNTDQFKFVEKDLSGPLVYLAQAVQLGDRKNIIMVKELFDEDMPDDALLILKTIPSKRQPELDVWVSDNVRLVQLALPFQEYYDNILSISSISVNPSSSEGFGYLAAEAMSLGMCTLVTNYSALTDIVDYGLPINYIEAASPYAAYPGKMAIIDQEHLLKQMLWCYENRKESLEIGRKSSKFVRDNFHPDIISEKVNMLMNKVVNSVKRTVLADNDIEKRIEWSYLKPFVKRGEQNR